MTLEDLPFDLTDTSINISHSTSFRFIIHSEKPILVSVVLNFNFDSDYLQITTSHFSYIFNILLAIQHEPTYGILECFYQIFIYFIKYLHKNVFIYFTNFTFENVCHFVYFKYKYLNNINNIFFLNKMCFRNI